MNKIPENAEVKNYNGFKWYEFDFNGHKAHIISPASPAPGNKWIWRAEFLGAFDSADIEMLRRGWYLVHYSISDMYGCPSAVSLMKDFYNLLVTQYRFDKQTVLFGFSRGGLYSVNFALKYPSLVRALYLDAPVLDIKSWPGGLGCGLGAEKNYDECLKCYGLNRSSVLTFRENPVDRVSLLGDSKIPVALVVGDSDDDVPYMENGNILADEYNRRGISLLYIIKKGCAHHPHSLEDPTEICDFLESAQVRKNDYYRGTL